jgi:putative endonuclease
MREFFVYILASHPFGALYVGVTNDLARRVAEHRSRAVPSHTRRYAIHRLVHVERFADPECAIRREKRLKRWPRDWKLELIKAGNPGWRDLADEL